jgi:hypothetical protein
MSNNNNTHTNGYQNVPNGEPRVHELLQNGETIDDPNIKWLERFNKFLQQYGIEQYCTWFHQGPVTGPWEVTLTGKLFVYTSLSDTYYGLDQLTGIIWALRATERARKLQEATS